MDFELDDTQTLVRDTAREFARKTLRPQAATFEREQVIPEEVFRQMGELGLLAIHVPEELGGSGMDVVSYSAAMIEIAQGCASTAVTMAVTNMVGEVIAEFGDQGQKESFCPRIASGEILGGFALSEVDAGSDPGGMRTTAVRDGDDWILNGTKQWISHGDTAGVLVVWARTSDAPGAKGVSCFLVEGGNPGLAVAGHEDKMGLRASHTCSLVFEDCRVPATALLGSLDGGFRIAMMALDGGRIGIASQAIGIAEGALGDAIAYAKDRKAFERSIADFQAVQWMIADSRMELDAARLLTWRAARLKSDAQPFTQEASMAKLYASEAAWAVCNRALQVHGGYGYMREYAVERALRDVRVTQIYEGTSEVQRLVIARNALRA
ncbi:MAG TPA: acyl-CoA dehydrogenase family protein [Polyangiaceae bacterium LLY-WYZ-14_1]|nr:acyl-CoA dehydrogenase family protein [Polyangiaceae bacterium LLY-WYZ-14_1]